MLLLLLFFSVFVLDSSPQAWSADAPGLLFAPIGLEEEDVFSRLVSFKHFDEKFFSEVSAAFLDDPEISSKEVSGGDFIFSQVMRLPFIYDFSVEAGVKVWENGLQDDSMKFFSKKRLWSKDKSARVKPFKRLRPGFFKHSVRGGDLLFTKLLKALRAQFLTLIPPKESSQVAQNRPKKMMTEGTLAFEGKVRVAAKKCKFIKRGKRLSFDKNGRSKKGKTGWVASSKRGQKKKMAMAGGVHFRWACFSFWLCFSWEAGCIFWF